MNDAILALAREFDLRFGDAVEIDAEIDACDAVDWISEFAPRLRAALIADEQTTGDWLVCWETNAFEADSPEEAAMQAWNQMRDSDHVPSFTVTDPQGVVHTVDMDD